MLTGPLLRLLAVLALLAGAALWWRLQLDPDVTIDGALRLLPAAPAPELAAPPRTQVVLPAGTRLAWRTAAERPGLRLPVVAPAADPVLRFAEATLQGIPDFVVRVRRADGELTEVQRAPATEGDWTVRRVELPALAGESLTVELAALDGRGRPDLGEVLFADVVLESAGRAVDEGQVTLAAVSVVQDLLGGTAAEQLRQPASDEQLALGLPGPLGLPLIPGLERRLRLDPLPDGARLELVLHAARAAPGEAGLCQVRLRLDGEEQRVVRVDDLVLPLGDQPPAHERLVTLDLSAFRGAAPELALITEGREALAVALREAVVIQRGVQLPRRFDPGRGVNLLLFVVEGLRADRLALLGYGRGRTPHLDALAQRGILWSSVLAPAGWGLPNLVSLFTGLSPLAHGVGLRDGRVLSPRVTTLGRAAGWAGLLTGVFSNSSLPAPAVGLLDDMGRVVVEPVPATILAEHAGDWLADAGAFQWFMTLLLSDPLWPHEPEAADLVGVDDTLDAALVDSLRRLDSRPGAAESLAFEVSTLADAELTRVDRALGQVLAMLEERGLLERTVVAVVGLHGQEQYERGARHLGGSLHDEIVRVPVIIAGPGVVSPDEAPVLVRQPVDLADVAHLLGHVGRILSTGWISDRVPPPYGPDRPLSTHHAVLTPCAGVASRSLLASRRDGWLLLTEPHAGRSRLFDLERDPGALDDLLAHEPVELLPAATAEALAAARASFLADELGRAPARPVREGP